MEDNKNGGYSAEGRKLRPRKKVSFAGSDRTENRNHEGDGHRSYGQSERRPYNNQESRPYGERRNYGDGERRPYNKPYGERRSYGDGEHRAYNKPYGERRSYGDGEQRPYNKPYGERRSYGDGEQRPYNKPYGERRNFADGERKPQYNKPYGERRGYGDGEQRPQYNKPYGERRNFADAEQRPQYGKPYGEGRPYGEGGKRPYGGGRKPYAGQRPSGPKPAARGKGRKKFEAQFDESAESGINRMIERRPNINNAQYSDNDYVPAPIQNEIRLNKFIANSGVCSRREADTFIQAGVVTVNGEVVTELGTKVNVLTDDVRFNGERLKGEEKVYIVMNKPKGYVTTASDPHAGKTVMDLLKNCDIRVFPVGRLDKATTGVLMFTNDGEIAERLTHPSYDKKKIYQVILDRELSQEDYDKILSGIELSDGIVVADELEYIDAKDHRRLGIEIHSGKNRIVRRIFESMGYTVKALDRVYFAGLTKKGLNKGEWRYLTEGEVNILKMGAYV